jgi:hypothetical protein
MQTVYRVETVDGRGAYRATFNPHVGRTTDEFGNDRIPAPREDGLSGFTRDHYFGFASVEQLQAWFTRADRANLHECGLSMSVYLVDPDDVKYGRKQVCFVRHKARLVERLPLI